METIDFVLGTITYLLIYSLYTLTLLGLKKYAKLFFGPGFRIIIIAIILVPVWFIMGRIFSGSEIQNIAFLLGGIPMCIIWGLRPDFLNRSLKGYHKPEDDIVLF